MVLQRKFRPLGTQQVLWIALCVFLAVNTAATQSVASESESAETVPRTGTVTLAARDAQTGYSVPATVSYGRMEGDFPLPFRARADNEGRIRLTLPLGTYLFEICAPGHQSMRSYQPVGAGGMIFHMDPTEPPQEMREDILNAQLRPGYAMLFGYVVDDLSAKPLNNVHVYLRDSHVETRTNARGYYALFARVPTAEAEPSSLPPMDTLVAEMPGYTSLVYHRLPLDPGQWSRENVQLSKGTGTTESSYHASWMPDDSETPQPQESVPLPDDRHPISPALLQWLSVPARPCH